MAFKFIAFCSVLAFANAGILSPVHYTSNPTVGVVHKVAYANPAEDSVASTHQNVVRTFDGTVSTYSKAVDTAYSSVRKEDTRISNNVYTPAIQKTIAYTNTPVVKSVTYAAAPVVEKKTVIAPAPAPAVHTSTYVAPVVEKPSFAYAAPAVTKTFLAPVQRQTVYSHPDTTIVSHYNQPSAHLYESAIQKATAPASILSKPITAYAAAPTVTTYNHGPAATTYAHNAPGISGYGSSQTVHYSPANMVSHMSFDGFGTHWSY